MANHSATKKSIRKTITRTAVNKSRKSRIKTFVKKVENAISCGDVEKVNQAFIKAQSEIMKGVSTSLIKKNTASRKISKLAKRMKNVLA